eukprot:scaffold38384_cov63-Phaeocystis_antarctica.AAC.1
MLINKALATEAAIGARLTPPSDSSSHSKRFAPPPSAQNATSAPTMHDTPASALPEPTETARPASWPKSFTRSTARHAKAPSHSIARARLADAS